VTGDPKQKPLAERYFEASCAEMSLRGEVEDIAEEVFGDGWSGISMDHYDESIEITGHAVIDSPKARDMFRAAGFARAWFHARECEPPRGNGCKCPCISLR
jgi:hypothetical protein